MNLLENSYKNIFCFYIASHVIFRPSYVYHGNLDVLSTDRSIDATEIFKTDSIH